MSSILDIQRPGVRPALRVYALCLGAALTVTAGCSTMSRVESARNAFYAGRLADADRELAEVKTDGINGVLVLMERGTIRQADGRYDDSARDLIAAHDRIEKMTAISLSQDTGSMIVNDQVQAYRGSPYERTMLHVFAAQDHLAVGNWENAAVEARRIIHTLDPEQLCEYPEDAYSRYMAGFCLEMIGDPSNASLQYRLAAARSHDTRIDPQAGTVGDAVKRNGSRELVCFVMAGRSPRGEDLENNLRGLELPVYAEIRAGDRVLGRSYTLTDIHALAYATAQKDALRKAAKTAARIALKETVAHQVGKNDEMLGALVGLVLIGIFEQPDYRRWETLPRWLQVARVPCPTDLTEFDVIFRNSGGAEISRKHMTGPFPRNGHVQVVVVRDVPSRVVP